MNKQNLVIKLSNGLKVANFSSGHDFHFVDGTILRARNGDHVKRMILRTTEVTFITMIGDIEIKNIDLKFSLTKELIREIEEWENLYTLHVVDIVITPLPVLQCIQRELHDIETEDKGSFFNHSPFRTVRAAQRAVDNKPPVIHIDKFCY